MWNWVLTRPGNVPNWEWAASEGKPKPLKLPHSGWPEVSEWSSSPGWPNAGNPAELRDIFRRSSPIICNKWPENKHKEKTACLKRTDGWFVWKSDCVDLQKRKMLHYWIQQYFINPTHKYHCCLLNWLWWVCGTTSTPPESNTCLQVLRNIISIQLLISLIKEKENT